MTDLSKWTATLKPGDEVAYDTGRGTDWWPRRVVRLTATQVVIEGAGAGTEIRCRRIDGYEMGRSSQWSFPKILPITPEMIRIAEKRDAINLLNGMSWHHAPDDLIFECARLVKAAGETR